GRWPCSSICAAPAFRSATTSACAAILLRRMPGSSTRGIRCLIAIAGSIASLRSRPSAEMSGRSISRVDFFLDVDLQSFNVLAFPDLLSHQGLVIAFSGYLATASGTRSAPDPALQVAAAYRRHGTRLSAELLGQYSAAIVDPAARRLVLVQDSLGLQPLFYLLESDRARASSNLEWLAAARWPAELDEEYFAEFITCGRNSARRTPFRGIERLACGTTLSIGRGRVSALRPWAPPRQPQ